MAMTSYLKGVEGGDCVAMMNIGGLYFNGDGVSQDRAQAQNWFTKAESCQGKDLDWLRERAAKYRERAASGALPALRESKPPEGELRVSKPGEGEKLLPWLLSIMAIAAALEANGVGGGSGGPSDGPSSGSAGVGGSRSTPAPVRHCRQVQVGSFSTAHGRGAISPGGATTTVCD
jgi:hypothetical protein